MENKIIEKFIKLLEDAKVKVKGGKGFSTGTIYQEKEVNQVYGKSDYATEPEIEEPESGKVEISNAFDNQSEENDE